MNPGLSNGLYILITSILFFYFILNFLQIICAHNLSDQNEIIDSRR